MKKLAIIPSLIFLLASCTAKDIATSSTPSSANASSTNTSSSSGILSENSVQLAFLSPTTKTTFNEAEIFNVEVGAVNAAEIAKIELFVDGVFFRAELTAPWDWNPTKGDTLLQSLLPGSHILKAVATTTSGASYLRSVQIEISPAAFRVTGLSLVDVNRATTVANYDPIYMGEQVAINLDALGISQYSFTSAYEGNIGSVSFTVNDTLFRTDNSPPFALTQNTGPAPLPVELAPGAYKITATPYAQINAGGAAGPGKTINLLIQKSNLQWPSDPIRLVASLDNSQQAATELLIKNSGNIAATISVATAPSWLTVGNVGSVDAGAERKLTLNAPACNQARQEKGTLTLERSSDKSTTNIEVEWSCSDRPAFDFALSRFYFNQVVPQNDSTAGTDGSKVALVKGREGLARAFVVRNNTNTATIPSVDLHYRLANGTTGQYPLLKTGNVPTEQNEGDINNSFNALIPKEFFQPGTEYYVQVNASGGIAENSDQNNRHPATGYRALNIVSPRVLELVFVPLFVPGNKDFTLTESNIRELMSSSTVFLPINEYTFTIRAPASYSGTDWVEAIQVINTIRLSEDRNKFYHGIVNGRIGNSNTGGIAQLASNSGLSMPDPETIAHELGHNLSLSHTNCGGPAQPEVNYPYANARTGNWGYDIQRKLLVAPDRADFMSYCNPVWVGSFGFQKMVSYFALGQRPQTFQFFAPAIIDPTIISGSIKGAEAQIDHVYDAKGDFSPVTGESSPYQLKLYDAAGVEIYSTLFEAQALDHSSTLLFDVPVEAALLANESHQIKIFHGEQVLLDQPWLSQSPYAQRVNLQEQLNVVSDEKVIIRWNAAGEYTLWVRDADTGNILGMDRKGELTLHTKAKRLELTYASQSKKIRRVIEVPAQ